MSMTVPDQAIPEGPRLSLRCAESPGRVHRHVHQPIHRHRGSAPARGHRRRRAAAAAGARLAADLVPVPARHAGAGPGLRGRRRRPARHRAVRQAPRRVRHRHPRRRPGRAHGFAWPPAVRDGRLRHRDVYRLCAGHGSPGPARAAGRRGGLRPGRVSLTAPVRPRAAQRAALAPRLQPARHGERRSGQGTGGHLFGAEYAAWAGTPLPDEVVKYYVDRLASDPEALRGSFKLYQALDVDFAQSEERKTRRLTMPVLVIGGTASVDDLATNAMKLVADDVQSVVIPAPGTGWPRRLPTSSCPR